MNKFVAGLVALALAGCASTAGTSKGAAPEKSAKPPAEKAFVENAQGLIVIEAENFDANVDKNPHKWTPVTAPPGFSGKGAMEALPNTEDANINEDIANQSPRMDYKVRFAKAGKYKVWVRGFGRNIEDNSCHVGLDGKVVDACDKLGEFSEEWSWLNESSHDSESAELDIKAAGVHTLNVWMRENGFVIDKILLTQDAKYTPTGAGPAETRE